MKQKLFITLVATIVLVSSWIPGSSFAEKKPQEKLKEIQKQKQNVEKEVDKVKGQLDQSKQEVEKLETQIEELDKKMAQYNEQMAANQKLLAKKEQQLKKFIRRMYIQGETRYMSKILTSKSFEEFLVRYQLISTLAKRESNVVTGYRETKEKITTAQKQLAASKQKQQPLIENAQKKLATIKSTYDKNSQQLEKITKEEEATKKDIEELQKLAKKASGDFNNNFGSGVLGFPSTQGMVYWNYGQNRGDHIHAGVDIPRPIGKPIYAADSGVVSLTKANPGGYGYYVMINHGGGLSTLYAHMYRSTVLVSVGQKVSKGQKIAEVGNNGRSSGPHLHFEVWKNGNPVNPRGYIN
ncbi:Murein DD-endopeptidase MepM and murein hydrolase activator NlpD, contain LysM domain [Seinonella peptonophila]|uniref:Murein DD-endopeptidase MepM and murein hydrolase activator NlpD, contain LysM domain n=1 Tax=Seinonella peptonophila TaxID=112248 RepID=A0A1M4XQ94_9BACL|nr:peptidoglycan DD-metalloendopeptidase family protein [Seinonella peptonophila]SHE95402.1 Murein DD-endopeptidase MepM and murein hydrolase activator NlpD, contain LysM domain [Seinonella peptonophila]